MAKKTYVLEGGVGKFVAFTAILPKLVEANGGEPVQIHGPHYQVFAGNPNVAMSFDSLSIPLDDPRIIDSDEIIYVEPYKNNFVKGDQHLIESFCEITGIEYDPAMRPEMYTDHAKEVADKWLADNGITGDYILIQFTGGQPTMNFAPGAEYASSNPGRNYPPYFVNYIVGRLRELYPDTTIIDATLPNEPGFEGTIKCDQHWTVVSEIMKGAKGYLAIDSLLNHLSAAHGVPGVVIWGNTRHTQFGYTHNANMTFHSPSKQRYNDWFKMDINDPRNVLVDPGDVLDVFTKDIYNKESEEVCCAQCAN